MVAAYESGIVFRGDIDIPIIDWRPYLEEELDMHNTHQSFASRQRMLNVDIGPTAAAPPTTSRSPRSSPGLG